MNVAALQAAGDGRARLGKLVALLGSNNAGERDNALAALGRALGENGLDWAWLADLATRGETPDSDYTRLFGRMVGERLRQGIVHAWSMEPGDARTVRAVADRLASGHVSIFEIQRALSIADAARLRAR